MKSPLGLFEISWQTDWLTAHVHHRPERSVLKVDDDDDGVTDWSSGHVLFKLLHLFILMHAASNCSADP